MNDIGKKVAGFALVFSVVVSSYLIVVQIVNTFKPEGLLKSFSDESHGACCQSAC
jgi:hypothetical protein